MSKEDAERDIDAKLADIRSQEDLLERSLGPRGDQVMDRVERLDAHGSLDATESAIRTEMSAEGEAPPDENKMRQIAADEQQAQADQQRINDLKKQEDDLEYQKRNLPDDS